MVVAIADEPIAVPRPRLEDIRRLYEQCLYLQPYRLAQAFSPLECGLVCRRTKGDGARFLRFELRPLFAFFSFPPGSISDSREYLTSRGGKCRWTYLPGRQNRAVLRNT
jgi:hypothetical protein